MTGRDDWAAQYQAGATLRQIAEADGVTIFAVWRHLDKLRVPRRNPGQQVGPGRELWVELYQQGMTSRQVAERVGRPVATVYGELVRRDVKMRPAGHRGGRGA